MPRFILLFTLLAIGCAELTKTKSDKITEESFDSIKKGMTIEEVEKLLGPGKKFSHRIPEKVHMKFAKKMLKGKGGTVARVTRHGVLMSLDGGGSFAADVRSYSGPDATIVVQYVGAIRNPRVHGAIMYVVRDTNSSGRVVLSAEATKPEVTD